MQITVDQLRGGLLARYHDRLGKGGFRYLLDAGTVCTNTYDRRWRAQKRALTRGGERDWPRFG